MITHNLLIPIQIALYLFPKSLQTPLIPYAPPIPPPSPIHLPNILQKPRQIPSFLRPQLHISPNGDELHPNSPTRDTPS